jgi:hypothetical protein
VHWWPAGPGTQGADSWTATEQRARTYPGRVKPRGRFTPYALVGVLALGTGLGIGIGLSETPHCKGSGCRSGLEAGDDLGFVLL